MRDVTQQWSRTRGNTNTIKHALRSAETRRLHAFSGPCNACGQLTSRAGTTSDRARLRSAFVATLVKDAEENLGLDVEALRKLPKKERTAAILPARTRRGPLPPLSFGSSFP
jgi:hypothetical protein